MSRDSSSGYDIISSLFSPLIAVYTSPDVESICLKNNLNFVELLKPFCKLNKDVLLKDPNNAPHTVKDLHVIFQYVNCYVPSTVEINRLLHEVVEREWIKPQPQTTANGEVTAILAANTPWYDSYLHVLLATQLSSEHEFLRHWLGCVFVVSTRHSDPLDQFAKFTQQQNQLQMHSSGFGSSGNIASGSHHLSSSSSSHYPRWFQHNIMKFYVLLNDVVDGLDPIEVEKTYSCMKSTYGSGHCHLLHINSRPLPPPNALRSYCDPWQQFLLPVGGASLNVNLLRPNMISNVQQQQPTLVQSIEGEKPSFTISENDGTLPLDNDELAASAGVLGPSSEVDFHPLVCNNEEDSLEDTYNAPNITRDSYRSYLEGGGIQGGTSLSNGGPLLAAARYNSPSMRQSPFNTSAHSDNCTSSYMGLLSISPCYLLVPYSIKILMQTPHGFCLTEDDMERLRLFVYDMVVKALVPWVEKTMKSLHDQQVANRTRISRSFLSATRRIFGVGSGGSFNNPSTVAPPLTAVVTSGGTGVGMAPSLKPASTFYTGGLSPSSSVASMTSTGQESSGGLLSGLSGYLPAGLGGGYATNPFSNAEGLHTVQSATGSLAYLASGGPSSTLNGGSGLDLSTTGSVATGLAASVVYSHDASEMQLRRYADLALLFQQYELAYQTYSLLKKDFQNENAWFHYAGAMECIALSTYLQGVSTQRPYPHHPWEQAISHYLHSKNVGFATRATILNTEAMKWRGFLSEATVQYTKLTTEAVALLDPASRNPKDNDLRSALFLEQTARCYARLRISQLRKYAFHLVMAAHRFSKCGQRQHSIRCYSEAYQVYQSRQWRYIDDHINRAIAHQSTALRQLGQALLYYQNLLTGAFYLQNWPSPSKEDDSLIFSNVLDNDKMSAMELLSHQSPEMQSALLRDYILIYKQYLASVIGDSRRLVDGALPQTRLPLIRPANSIRVLLETSITGDENPFIADTCSLEWRKLEKRLLKGINIPKNSSPSPPCMSEETNNSFGPAKTVVGESILVLIPMENPLQIPLLLLQVVLLWRMEVSDANGTSTISNECECDNLAATMEICDTEILQEIYLLPAERKMVQFTLIPKRLGVLHVIGVAYQLCSHSAQTLSVQSAANSQLSSSMNSLFSTTSTVPSGQFSGDRVSSPISIGLPPSGGVAINIGETDPLFNVNGSLSTESGVNFPSTETLSSAKTAPLPSWHNSNSKAVINPPHHNNVAVWCKTTLHVRGRRLHFTKLQRASQVYNKDFRLQFHVIAPMPLLRVTFSEMPTTLIQGEVRPVNMQIINIGSEPLTTLRVAVNNPAAVTFGLHELTYSPINPGALSQSPRGDAMSMYTKYNQQENGTCSLPTELYSTANKQWVNIPLNNGLLLPNAALIYTFWLRGYSSTAEVSSTGSTRITDLSISAPTAVGERREQVEKVDKLNLKMIFYYEGPSQPVRNNKSPPFLSYRLLRYHTDIRLLPALQMQALATRRRCGEPESIFVNLQATNLCSVQDSSELNQRHEALQILQVTAATSLWTLSAMKSCNNFMSSATTVDSESSEKSWIRHGLCLSPQESINLYFHARAVPMTVDDVDSLQNIPPTIYFSDVSFAGEGTPILSSTSPCADFFFRSSVPWLSTASSSMNGTNEVGKADSSDEDDYESGTISERQASADITAQQAKGNSEAFRVQLTLIVLWKWKRRVLSPILTMEETYGQCHIHIPVLDELVHYPYHPALTPSSSIRPILFQSVPEPDPRLDLQPLLMRSKMISLFLHHPSEVEHDFRVDAFLLVPINVKLYNASSVPTLVRIEAAGLDARHRRTTIATQSLANIGFSTAFPVLPHPPSLSVSTALPSAETSVGATISPLIGPLRCTAQFSWVGLCHRQLLLQPRESHTVTYTACFPRPGTYELLQLEVKAALLPAGSPLNETSGLYGNFCSEELTFVKQEAVFGSLIIVKQAS